MDSVPCAKCGEPVLNQQGFEIGGVWYCSICFVEKAQNRKGLSKDQLNQLRKEVNNELFGLLPRDALRNLIEDAFSKSLEKDIDSDAVIMALVNDIERMAGLALCRELLGIVKSMEHEMGLQRTEVENKIRRISQL